MLRQSNRCPFFCLFYFHCSHCISYREPHRRLRQMFRSKFRVSAWFVIGNIQRSPILQQIILHLIHGKHWLFLPQQGGRSCDHRCCHWCSAHFAVFILICFTQCTVYLSARCINVHIISIIKARIHMAAFSVPFHTADNHNMIPYVFIGIALTMLSPEITIF